MDLSTFEELYETFCTFIDPQLGRCVYHVNGIGRCNFGCHENGLCLLHLDVLSLRQVRSTKQKEYYYRNKEKYRIYYLKNKDRIKERRKNKINMKCV